MPELTVREKLHAEQEGEDPMRSERFEAAIKRAAALLSHFGDAQAEITFKIGSAQAAIGTGPEHMHECLRKLAVIGPVWTDNSGRSLSLLDTQNIGKDAVVFFISAFPKAELPPEIAARATTYRL